MPVKKPASKKNPIFIGCGGCLTVLFLMFLYSVFSASIIRTIRKEKLPAGVKTYDKQMLAALKRPETDISYSYYPVYGTTMREIDTSMTANMPAYEKEKFRAEGVEGQEAGRTEASHAWGVTPVQKTNECAMADVKLDSKIVIVMPQWKDREKASAALASEWDRFYKGLDLHEIGHRDLELQQFDEIWEVIQNTPTFEQCEEMQAYLDAEIDKVRAGNNERNMNYDRQTQHGTTQGASVQ